MYNLKEQLYKILHIIIVFSIIIMLFVILSLIFIEYKKTIKGLETTANMIFKTMNIVITNSYTINKETILNSLEIYDEIIYAAIYDLNDSLYTEYKSEKINIGTSTLKLKMPLYKNNNNIGILYVEKCLNDFIRSIVIKIYLLLLLFICFLFSIIILLHKIRFNIITPIEYLRKHTQNIIIGKYEQMYYDINGEIGELIFHFNNMIMNLRLKDVKIKEQTKELETKIDLQTRKLIDLNNLYSGILNSQFDLISRTDDNGNLTFANKKYIETFGISDITKFNFINVIHEEDFEIFKKDREKLLEEPYQTDAIFRCVTKERDIRWFQWESILSIQNNQIQSVGRDIHDSKIAQIQLQEKEHEYETLIENLSDCVFKLDANFIFTYCSTRIKTILGRSAKSVIGMSFRDLFIPPSTNYIAELTENDYIDDIEVIAENIKTKKMVTIQFDLGLQIENGQIIGYQGMFRDISYRKILENQILQSSKMFKEVMNASPISIIIVDMNFKILYMNDQAMNISLPIDINNKLETNKITSAVNNFSNDRVLRSESLLDNRWYEFIFKEINYNLQDAKLIIIRDIHNEKEKSLELEEKVKERTKQLEVINAELESFAYSVSHDLTAPLRQINGCVKFIREKVTDEESKKWLDYLQTSSVTLGSLISGLLELSRASRGELNLKLLDMSVPIKEIWESCKNNNNMHGKQLIIEQPLNMYCDVKMMTSVFMNLINNALKFGQDNIQLIITIGHNKEKDAYFVKDNGPGFDNKFADNLFKVFQTNSHKYSGSGIGLSTVQRIINKHGGQVWAESDGGAIFYFSILNG